MFYEILVFLSMFAMTTTSGAPMTAELVTTSDTPYIQVAVDNFNEPICPVYMVVTGDGTAYHQVYHVYEDGQFVQQWHFGFLSLRGKRYVDLPLDNYANGDITIRCPGIERDIPVNEF